MNSSTSQRLNASPAKHRQTMRNQDIGVGIAAVVTSPRHPGKIITGIRKGSLGGGMSLSAFHPTDLVE